MESRNFTQHPQSESGRRGSATKEEDSTLFVSNPNSIPAGGREKFKPGTLLGGAYKVIHQLGKGGMGDVYRTRHVVLEKDFAVKVLTGQELNNANWLRFQTEAKVISRLDHKNIVKVYNLGLHQDIYPFYAMDLLEGEPLDSVLTRFGTLKVDDALPIYLQVVDGLYYAHKHGVIHRDIKPANMMLILENGSTPAVKILDFGIAKLSLVENKAMQSLTAPGEIFGSPLYMSPEQCIGQSVDARSDIYSLGCALFETLTGRPPLRGENTFKTILMHQSDAPPSLKEVTGKEFSPGIEHVVARCLRKKPEDRYQSMKELEVDLIRVGEGKDMRPTYINLRETDTFSGYYAVDAVGRSTGSTTHSGRATGSMSNAGRNTGSMSTGRTTGSMNNPGRNTGSLRNPIILDEEDQEAIAENKRSERKMAGWFAGGGIALASLITIGVCLFVFKPIKFDNINSSSNAAQPFAKSPTPNTVKSSAITREFRNEAIEDEVQNRESAQTNGSSQSENSTQTTGTQANSASPSKPTDDSDFLHNQSASSDLLSLIKYDGRVFCSKIIEEKGCPYKIFQFYPFEGASLGFFTWTRGRFDNGRRFEENRCRVFGELKIPEPAEVELKVSNTVTQDPTVFKGFHTGDLTGINLDKMSGSTHEILSNIRHLQSLKSLNINSTSATNADFDSINALKKLERLELRKTAMTGDCIAKLSRLPYLTVLNIREVENSMAVLPKLKGSTFITCLKIGDQPITNEQIDLITTMPNLDFLQINQAHITDNQLVKLAKLKKLKSLCLTNCNLSPAAIDIFKSKFDQLDRLTLDMGGRSWTSQEQHRLSKLFGNRVKFEVVANDDLLRNLRASRKDD